MTVGSIHDAPDARTTAAAIATGEQKWRVVMRLAGGFLAAATFLYWQRIGARMAFEHPETMNLLGDDATAGAWLAAGQLLGNLFEAALYVSAWRLAGVRVGWLALAAGIFAASAFEAGSWQLAMTAHSGIDDSLRGVIALLAGPRVLWDDATGQGGLGVAFGGAGLLALVRIACTAETQTRAGAPRAKAFGMTFAAWLTFRLLAGFGLDLLRGFSPLGG